MNGRDLPAGVYRKRPDGGLLVVKVSLPERGQVYVGCFRTVAEATSARDDALRNGVSSDRKGARKKPQGRPVRDLPAGVHRHPSGKKFRAMVSVARKPVLLGYFDTVAEAEDALRQFRAVRRTNDYGS